MVKKILLNYHNWELINLDFSNLKSNLSKAIFS
jgi:hypothetical protein